VNVKIEFIKLIQTFSKFLNRRGQKWSDVTKLLTGEGSPIEFWLTDRYCFQLRSLGHNTSVNVTLIAPHPIHTTYRM